jgi:hypothetical protein
MRFLILLPILLLPAADMHVFNPNEGTVSSCPPTSRYQAMQKNRRPDAKKLNELPAADHYKAVYRRVGNCEVPIIAGYNIGGR